MPAQKPESNGTARGLEQLKGFSTLLLPVVAVTAAYYTTTGNLRSDISALRSDVTHIERSHAAAVSRMQRLLEDLERRLDEHRSSGPDGLNHPQGVIRSVKDLERRVEILEAR
jgi:hypothetical protein